MSRHLTRTSAIFLIITTTILVLSYNLSEYLNIFNLFLQWPCRRIASTPISRKMSMANTEVVDLTGKTSEWLQNRFTSLYQSVPPPPEEEYNMTSLVYSAFGKDAEIFLNHEKLSLQKFQEDLEAANFGAAGSTVEWKELMEVSPTENDEGVGASIVAGVFVVTRASKFLIRASPAIRLHFNTFSAKIEQDKAAQPDENDYPGSDRMKEGGSGSNVDASGPMELMFGFVQFTRMGDSFRHDVFAIPEPRI